MRLTPATCAGTTHMTSVETSLRGAYTPTVSSGTQRRSSTTPGSTSSLTFARALHLVPAPHAIGELEDRRARQARRVRHRAHWLDAVELERPLVHRREPALLDLGRDRHAAIRSTGTIRIDEPPAASSSGRRRQISAAGTNAWTATIPGSASGSTLGTRGATSAEIAASDALRRVQHHVAMPACLDDGAQHRREGRCDRVVAGHEHRLRLEQHAQRAQAVRAQGVPGRDQVDDRGGEPQPRSNLDRARDVDERDVDRQQLSREPRIDRRHSGAGELLERGDRRLLGHRGLEPAGAEPELQQLEDVRTALAHEVDPRDPAVDDAVLNVFRHVGGANEQHLDRRVAAREGQRAVARLLGPEAGVFEQVHGRVAQPALGRNGNPQEAERSSAS